MAGQKIRNERFAPESLRNALERFMGRPYLAIRGPVAPGDADALEQAYTSAYARAREIWLKSHDAIRKQLVDNDALNAQMYRGSAVRQWLEGIEACFAASNPGLDLFDRIDQFTPQALKDGTKEGRAHAAGTRSSKLATFCMRRMVRFSRRTKRVLRT